VLRSVPRDNEATNEAWLSDRDRYSHLGLYSDDRVVAPQLKVNDEWTSVSWDEAAEAAVNILKQQIEQNGPDQLGVLMSPSCPTEEYFLAQGLARKLGCNNIDHRMREQDFSDDACRSASPAFEAKIAGIENADAVLLLGCNPQQEAPILGHRLRKAWRNGAAISVINPLDWSFTFETSLDALVAPQNMVAELAALASAVERNSGKPAPDTLRPVLDVAIGKPAHEELARRLQQAGNGLLLLGQFAMSHPDAAWLRSLAGYIADATGTALNQLAHGGNPVGAWQAGAVPHRSSGGTAAQAGMSVVDMLENPRKCYLLWDLEPDFDVDNPARTMAALAAAEKVIAVASYATDSLRAVADLILPLAPLAESEGSLLNFDGDIQCFTAAASASGDARPGWKILRRLGAELDLDGFDQVSLGQLQSAMNSALGMAAVEAGEARLDSPQYEDGLYRIGELPMYSIDALCRRSEALQQTVQAQSQFVGLNPADAQRLGLADGAMAKVHQGDNSTDLEVRTTEEVPSGGAWVRSATCATRELGQAVAPVIVEVA
jgi:NADH-quinone oxidoreductase subunit G